MKKDALAIVGALLATAGCMGKIGSVPNGSSTGSPTGAPGASTGSSGGSSSGMSMGSSGGSSGLTPPRTVDCTVPSPLLKPRIWRLTQSQMTNTLSDSFGFIPPAMAAFPTDSRLTGFANRAADLTVSPLLADGYFNASDQLGAQVAANPAQYGITCTLAKLGTGTCLTTFINTFGQKMWRRPLTAAEATNFASLYATTATQGDGPTGGIKAVVQALFLSPNFVHRTELGASSQAGTVVPLTDFELASELSYTLWDSAPDAPLMALAAQSKLHDPTVLASQAQRLFSASAKAGPAMNSFIEQWLFLETLGDSTKDTTAFPLAVPTVAQALVEENRLFVNSVIFDPTGDRSLKTLLTASYTFLNSANAPIYGVQGVTGATFTQQQLDPSQRQGILSLAPFMWGHATADGTNLPGRGSYFRTNILCSEVGLPAGGVPQAGKFAPANSTGRQIFAIHSDPACAVCHQLFDGIGFAMENYDAIGDFRLTDQGQTIDPSGTLPLPSRPDGPDLVFSNFTDLMDQISNLPDAYDCFASQYLSYTSGSNIDDLSTCDRQKLATQFASANHKIDGLVMNVVGSPNFMSRQNP
jgi:Protein of unknown function (DUF1592)/Protein of unknown function (DUF1588)/Protein of unknown function (DUF1595)/Protein of unknown function (DUF1587)/Protein of unknown function (DUF1585)